MLQLSAQQVCGSRVQSVMVFAIEMAAMLEFIKVAWIRVAAQERIHFLVLTSPVRYPPFSPVLRTHLYCWVVYIGNKISVPVVMNEFQQMI